MQDGKETDVKKVGTQETLQRMMRGNLFGFSLTVESVKYADHPDLSQVSGNDGTVPVFRVNELSDYWKTKPEALLRKVPDDEKLMRKVFASGQTRKLMYVTEQGLYRLLFKSTHPDADLFLRWVTYEILPSIRKTGLYCGDVASLAAEINGEGMKTKEKKRSSVRYPGICRHAEILGVRREHLWMVLVGQRESRSLILRYRALVNRERAS